MYMEGSTLDFAISPNIVRFWETQVNPIDKRYQPLLRREKKDIWSIRLLLLNKVELATEEEMRRQNWERERVWVEGTGYICVYKTKIFIWYFSFLFDALQTSISNAKCYLEYLLSVTLQFLCQRIVSLPYCFLKLHFLSCLLICFDVLILFTTYDLTNYLILSILLQMFIHFISLPSINMLNNLAIIVSWFCPVNFLLGLTSPFWSLVFEVVQELSNTPL